MTSDLIEHVIRPLLPEQFAGDDFDVLCNPTGAFELGGPHADCGLTGRKIIVDTYGGMARHGGGAFSGKDPTKVDRSAAYAVRHVAKNVVAAGIARRCEVQVAYAIGVAHPVSVMVETFGTSEIDPAKLPALVKEHFDLRPAAIIERLDLRRPIYQQTAAYGHFGRDRTRLHLGAHRRRRRARRRRQGARLTPTSPFSHGGGTPFGHGGGTPFNHGGGTPVSQGGGVCRVQPDVPAVRRAFDYLVPDEHASDGARRHPRAGPAARATRAGMGARSRRRPRDVDAPAGRLLPIAGVVSAGPPADVVDLCRWAAWRWAGPVADLPAQRLAGQRGRRRGCRHRAVEPAVYPPPAAARSPMGRRRARRRATGLRRGGGGAAARSRPRDRAWSSCPARPPRHDSPRALPDDGREVALLRRIVPRDRAHAAWEPRTGGACVVVGGRTAVWAPVPDLATVIVLDEADEAFDDERAPTWSARDVAVERARRAGASVRMVTPAPSVEAVVSAGRASHRRRRPGGPVPKWSTSVTRSRGRRCSTRELADALHRVPSIAVSGRCAC